MARRAPDMTIPESKFDVVFYDHTNLDSAEQCRQELVEHIRAGLEGEVDSPISDFWHGLGKDAGIPRFNYGYLWVLRDKETGKLFSDMGRLWAKQFRHDFDHRSLWETGIRPGMRPEAIRPPKRLFKQHP